MIDPWLRYGVIAQLSLDDIVVVVLDSKHSNGFCLVVRHTQTLPFE